MICTQPKVDYLMFKHGFTFAVFIASDIRAAVMDHQQTSNMHFGLPRVC